MFQNILHGSFRKRGPHRRESVDIALSEGRYLRVREYLDTSGPTAPERLVYSCRAMQQLPHRVRTVKVEKSIGEHVTVTGPSSQPSLAN